MEGSERPLWNGDVRSAVRVYGGWLVALIGAILCAVGWYGVSGEKHEARQIPYLASATVPGAALIIAGAVLIAARQRGGGTDAEVRRRVEELHVLLVEPVEGGEGGSAGLTPVRAAGDALTGGAGAAEVRSRADAGSPSAGVETGAGAGSASGAAAPEPAAGAVPGSGTGSSVPSDPAASPGDGPFVALPGGARYHRPDCDLVRGKAGVARVTPGRAAELDLRACALCDPDETGSAPAAEAARKPAPDAD